MFEGVSSLIWVLFVGLIIGAITTHVHNCDSLYDHMRFVSILVRAAVAMVPLGVMLPFVFNTSATAQTLPTPTGDYSIGRIRFHWVDQQRSEMLADEPRSRRELNVEVWYPSKINQIAATADYLPDLAAISAAIPNHEFSDEFDTAASSILAGHIKTHSVVAAPVASSPKEFPVIIFSHGLGVPPEGYTSQNEDLASHGFVVVGIEHTFDAFVSVFPDGRIIDYEEANWDHKKGAVHAAYTRKRVDVWASDITFVIDQLVILDKTRSLSVLSGRLDMKRLGALGHSMGGLAVIEACQRDRRIRTCVDEDSLIDGTPFADTSKQMAQPFMIFLTSANYVPMRTDAQLARGGVDRATFNANVRRSQGELRSSLRSHGGRPALVVLRNITIDHMNFSDFKILQSQNEQERVANITAIDTVRTVISAFFSSSFLNRRSEFERLRKADSPVEVIALH